MSLLIQQEKALIKQLPNKVGALFMKMGTGKTRVALELVNAVPEIRLVVWIGPLRSIKPIDESIPSIKDEIAKWGGFNAPEVIYMGVETLQSSDRQFLQLFNKIRNSLDTFLIVDESIKIKNHDAKRTKRLLEMSKWCEYKLILNGEPITRDLIDLWPQFEFLAPEILNMGLAEFKNTFCKYTTITKNFGGYKNYVKEFITGYENIDYLYSMIGEYVFECDLDLNINQIFETANYQLSDEEQKNYKYLKEKHLDDEKLMAMNNNIFLEMTQKMQHEYSLSEGKFEAVKNWITDESKTIIFCKYIASANECRKQFPKATVLNYKTGSMSLNLQDRPHTIYFDQTFDWGDVIQSQHRNYRTGQSEDCRYLRLIGNVGLENLIFENNKKKLGISEYFKKISREQLQEIL
ncbi:DEAD/DEAH box helicase [Chryseobacterium sp. MP_3.2]|uniref:DEAD/DEAH box helicase n=1 Tax=Chryseobacterium sp. MP_3.2 TaxID=3071712 RepID=UPI002DF8B39D|nr:hypothetical protein [Chryseobacterium sp. MP_3.2]